ncbi:heme/hemin ABC transporter substrate-binding protein [Roseibium sp.]|uniref:heme/hemin ABC transporter substrate-binding protein n=1 Tax=Roseibium sp. TaxID=1936156 RepID=UPI003A97C48A
MNVRTLLSRTSRLASLLGAFVFTAAPTLADEPASRIVSVGGSITEIVYALGEKERLVARDSTSTYPTETSDLPDVGYIRRLAPEGVLSVSPDLLLMLEGSGPPETVDLLQKSGLRIITVPEAYSPEGILEKVRIVGDALGVPEKAKRFSDDLRTSLNKAHEKSLGQADGIKVLFVLSNNGGRVLASGSGTAASNIIALAGAKNATPEFEGYKQLTDEAIMQAAPDVVLMMSNGANHGDTDVFANPALASTPAGQNNRIIKMPGSYLLGFGPRTADAILELSEKLSAIKG